MEQLHHRLGVYQKDLACNISRRPRIWLHAASVGEVGVAVSLVHELRRCDWGGQVIISTTTEPGMMQARALAGKDTFCFFAPIDWLPAVNKALDLVRPDLLAILETEIWPNLLACTHRRGVRTAIINGRISDRTVNRYQKIRPLMHYVLSRVDAFSMISDIDAQRIHSIGAPRNRIRVSGNAKFDAIDPSIQAESLKWARQLFDPDQIQPPVFVAGSTRAPEEQLVLDAFIRMRQYDSRLLLIIAPRHIERCDQIEQWVLERGLSCQRRSRISLSNNLNDTAEGDVHRRVAPVILLDTIGELPSTYGIADVVFCGGSLVPKGGQNILEPALWAKPIMYGPSMEDFAQAKDLIETAGGGRCVFDAETMAEVALDWLRHPATARKVGQAARNAVVRHRGAARKHVDILLGLLKQ